jgi:hypothetical protein
VTLSISPSLDVRESREFASEVKFQVPEFASEEILNWARSRLLPDPNANDDGQSGAYQITSLYFDTEGFDVYNRNGSFGRSKYRIRRYGPAKVAFLERKLKTRGLVSKRRAAVVVEELQRLQNTEPDPCWPGFWYHQRLLARQLKPVCQITYRRLAWVGLTNHGPVRLTLDHCIQTVPLELVGFNDRLPGVPISDHDVIVEFKFRCDMPLLFKELVEKFALTPKRISKYRLAVVALGLVEAPELTQPQSDSPKPVCLSS